MKHLHLLALEFVCHRHAIFFIIPRERSERLSPPIKTLYEFVSLGEYQEIMRKIIKLSLTTCLRPKGKSVSIGGKIDFLATYILFFLNENEWSRD